MDKQRLKSISKISNELKRLGRYTGVLAVVAAAFLIGYLLRPAAPVATGSDHADHTAQPAKTQWWTCSMHPQIKLTEPGLCPICNMDLIPLEEGDQEGGSLRTLTVSENASQLMDIETAPVERRFASVTVRMVGKVDYDETKLATISAWVPGRLDRLFVDYTGVTVQKGDHMVSLYSPDLYSAQVELLQARRAVSDIQRSNSSLMRDVTQSTVEAARDKLRLWGLSDEQIQEIETSGKPQDHITINAPVGGVVIHKNALEGEYVETGTKIYTIADLSQVWVYLDAYESDLQWLRYGQKVAFTTVAYPGEIFRGTVAFIDPVLNDKTRTVRVRVNVPNPEGKLKPKMFVKAEVEAQVAAGGKVMDTHLAGKWISPMHPEIVKDEPGQCDICGMPLVRTESLGYAGADPETTEKPLVIPASAVLITGTRAVVYVQLPNTQKPTFEGREIVLGPRAGDYYLVRSGLSEGEQVVVSGNFKIDSSLQILAKPSMMTPDGSGGGGGHDHGSSGPAAPDASPAAGTDVPPLFTKQLHGVLSAAGAVEAAMDTDELTRIQNAYAQLEKALGEVDMSLLTGHPHMLWMEYRMRLSNDAVEGQNIKTLQDAQRVYGSLKNNLGAIRNRFGLEHKSHAGSQPPLASPQLQKQLGTILESYYGIQRSLAADDLAKAREAFQCTLDAMESVDEAMLSEEIRKLWANTAGQLKTALANGAAAEEITAARESFHLLSQVLTGALERFGVAGTGSVYVLHCPMAFNNTGARWLQNSKDVTNPYFGASMLRCGSVEDMIMPSSQTEEKK